MKALLSLLTVVSSLFLVMQMDARAQDLVSPLTFSAPQKAYAGARLGSRSLFAVDHGPITVGGTTADAKPQVLFFFATYCQHCELTVPTVNTVYETLKENGKFLVVGVSVSPIENTRDFVARTGANFPVGVADNTGILNEIGVAAVPALIVVRNTGEVVFSHVGAMLDGSAAATIEAAYNSALSAEDDEAIAR